jgi:tetratricopeptide (TPR) repeat protein
MKYLDHEKSEDFIKDELYYDALELSCLDEDGQKEAIKLLNKALKMDPDYVQTYVGLVMVYGDMGKAKKYEEMVKKAYEKTLKKFPKWPKRMEWGYLSNRAYLRAIQYMGEFYWDNNENEKAIKIFKLLLRLNPNDNQGVRYELAGLYAGLKGDDVSDLMNYGNQHQDWSGIENLLKEQNKKHKFWKDPVIY